MIVHVLQVRKAAQQGVCQVLHYSDFMFSDSAPTHHPAAAATAKFCCKELEQSGGQWTHVLTVGMLKTSNNTCFW